MKKNADTNAGASSCVGTRIANAHKYAPTTMTPSHTNSHTQRVSYPHNRSLSQSVNQPPTQPINQPTNQPINQPVKQSTCTQAGRSKISYMHSQNHLSVSYVINQEKQSTNQPNNKSSNQSTNPRLTDESMNESVNQPASESTIKPANQPTSPLTNQSNNQHAHARNMSVTEYLLQAPRKITHQSFKFKQPIKHQSINEQTI